MDDGRRRRAGHHGGMMDKMRSDSSTRLDPSERRKLSRGAASRPVGRRRAERSGDRLVVSSLKVETRDSSSKIGAGGKEREREKLPAVHFLFIELHLRC
ncbi:hypothetical protein EYF80_064770 [Liparis tanakae]|uniref:Uncharacterized protein n=1 Tax=Liparis tanakae TaxID=230148 RepID=A0A4Z2EA07_9TELE|nr:hypothetical protein EYF80_064770 [Liparis tanakae]